MDLKKKAQNRCNLQKQHTALHVVDSFKKKNYVAQPQCKLTAHNMV